MDNISIPENAVTTISIPENAVSIPENAVSISEYSDRVVQLTDCVSNLYAKYMNHPYMKDATHNYICNRLPSILENIEKTHAERVQRLEELTVEQDFFINYFLSNTRYFYLPATESFFYYDGDKYKQYSEDDVLYNILSSISRDQQLMSWKHKTKVSVMKRIKENHLYDSIPESTTIQRVLNMLYPAVFHNKNEAKYFLTVLGDNIHRKEISGQVIHMVSSVFKNLINHLNARCQMWFGSNLAQSFKYKYHAEHNYANIRIINTSSSIYLNDTIWINKMLSENGLDLLCVACHYSNRYHNSDNYVAKYSNDDVFYKSVFHLKDMSPETLVSVFIGEYLRVVPNAAKIMMGAGIVVGEVTFSASSISWKNMMYLWKHFLEARRLPNVVISTKLRQELLLSLGTYYKESEESFYGINSKYLPSVCKFIQFWEDTMEPDQTEIEFEVSEISTLFNRWCEMRKETSFHISEKQVVDLIAFFYPDVELDQEKFVYKMRCSLWNKQMDILMAIDDLKEKYIVIPENKMRISKSNSSLSLCSQDSQYNLLTNMNISVYDAYAHYCNYMTQIENNRQPAPMLASKQYFEKFIYL
jgi:hypothetical protein